MPLPPGLAHLLPTSTLLFLPRWATDKGQTPHHRSLGLCLGSQGGLAVYKTQEAQRREEGDGEARR